jgi:hypothetical protein
MSQTVYLVSIGQYSDYMVVGVYSTEDAAFEKTYEYTGEYDYPEIEEFTLDE